MLFVTRLTRKDLIRVFFFFCWVELSSDLSQLLLAAPLEKYHLENTALSFALSNPLASAAVIKSKSMILDQQ